MAKKGLMIVIEGLDGAGKTTIAKWLVEYFKSNGYKALYTYEPNESLFVDALKKHGDVRSAELDALAYAADRLVHVRKVILPAIEDGYIVVVDRYYYSSIAYQGAQGAPIEWVMEVNKYAVKPDLAIYIDVDPETGLERLARESGRKPRFPEYEKINLLKKVRKIYLSLVEKGELIFIDGSRDLESVKQDVLNTILSRFRSWFST